MANANEKKMPGWLIGLIVLAALAVCYGLYMRHGKATPTEAAATGNNSALVESGDGVLYGPTPPPPPECPPSGGRHHTACRHGALNCACVSGQCLGTGLECKANKCVAKAPPPPNDGVVPPPPSQVVYDMSGTPGRTTIVTETVGNY